VIKSDLTGLTCGAHSTTAAFAEKLYAFIQGGIGGGAGAFVV
jgi:hypothetical protein